MDLVSSPCIRSTGSSSAKVAFVGEAPGEEEEKTGLPFVGYAGRELMRMFEETGFRRSEVWLSNVLFTRPPDNKIALFYKKKADLPKDYSWPAVEQGKYLDPVFLPEVERLYAELDKLRPNLVVALGNVASWALLGRTGISRIRGTVAPCHKLPWLKVLPTYHPSAVNRDWSLRPIVIVDLLKARREAEFPGISRPQRFVTINPTFAEIREFYIEAAAAKKIAIDVETRNSQITCAGFAISASRAIVIPFVDLRKQPPHYWATLEDECEAACWVQKLLLLPAEKIFQNGMYDIQYFLREGYLLHNCMHDTMLRHHSLFPEMLKGLGFMGSIYTDEPAWKLMRPRSKEADQLKRDDE